MLHGGQRHVVTFHTGSKATLCCRLPSEKPPPAQRSWPHQRHGIDLRRVTHHIICSCCFWDYHMSHVTQVEQAFTSSVCPCNQHSIATELTGLTGIHSCQGTALLWHGSKLHSASAQEQGDFNAGLQIQHRSAKTAASSGATCSSRSYSGYTPPTHLQSVVLVPALLYLHHSLAQVLLHMP